MSDHEKCEGCGRVKDWCRCERIEVRPEASQFVVPELELSPLGRRFAGRWRCSACGAELPNAPGDSSWRWAGDRWEHKCPASDPQAGHQGAVFLGEQQASLFPGPTGASPDDADDG